MPRCETSNQKKNRGSIREEGVSSYLGAAVEADGGVAGGAIVRALERERKGASTRPELQVNLTAEETEKGGALTWSPAAETARRGAETARARRRRVDARTAIGSAERGEGIRIGEGGVGR
jgi:hypothetical protein